jgi:hypothetical protein
VDDGEAIHGDEYRSQDAPPKAEQKARSVDHDLAELAAGLARDKVGVAIVDPLYLSLLAGLSEKSQKSAANMFDMGPLLLNVARACLDAGATGGALRQPPLR